MKKTCIALALIVIAVIAGIVGGNAQVPTDKVVKLDPALDALISVDAKIEKVASGFGFTEGPVWVQRGREGYLLFTDIPGNKVHKMTSDGEVSVYEDQSGYREPWIRRCRLEDPVSHCAVERLQSPSQHTRRPVPRVLEISGKAIHWNSIRQAAMVIKQLSERSPKGDANFNFGAITMMKPYGPYYPGSYHLGKGHSFAIAVEGAELVGDVFKQYKNPAEAEKQLTAVLSFYTKPIETVAMEVAKATGWSYEGIDATPAPLGDRSIGTAIEHFLGAPFGSPGTETAAGIITRAVQSTPVKPPAIQV